MCSSNLELLVYIRGLYLMFFLTFVYKTKKTAKFSKTITIQSSNNNKKLGYLSWRLFQGCTKKIRRDWEGKSLGMSSNKAKTCELKTLTVLPSEICRFREHLKRIRKQNYGAFLWRRGEVRPHAIWTSNVVHDKGKRSKSDIIYTRCS